MADEATGSDTAFDSAAVVDFIQNNGEPEAAPDQTTVDPADTAAPNEQTPTPNPLGPDPDVSDLDPATQALVNQRVLELRQGFTKRTTELADANRILEAAGGDPEAVLEAWTFQQMLMDDSAEGADARARLYQALNSQYGAQPPAVEPAVQDTTPDDPFSEYDLPPEIKEALSLVPQLKQQLDAINANQQAQEQEFAKQQYIQEVYEDLSNKWSLITTEHPDIAEYEDAVFALGAHTNGNLLEAVDIVRGIEARAQAKLFAGSVNVPGGQVSPPAGGGHSTEPVVIETFKDARAAALEYLERAQAEIG